MDKDSYFASPLAGLFIKIIVAINTVVLVIIITYPDENLSIKLYWPWLVLSTPLVLFLLWKHYNVFNTQLDKLVSRVVTSDHSDIPTALYLRPFVSDGAEMYLGKNSAADLLLGLLHMVNTTSVFEGRLLPVIYNKYIPIKLDYSIEESDKNESRNLHYKISAMFTYRFGRHFDNTEEWVETVRKVTKNCAICILAPPAKIDSSTAEEVSMVLKYSLLEKLVFIMPSKRGRFKTNEGVKVFAKQLWENLLQITKDKVQLPNYSENGGFVLPVNGQMMLIESCHGFDWFSKKAMKKIFIDGKLTCSMWLGALKVTYKLVWLFLPLSFLYAGLIFYVFLPHFSASSEGFGILLFLTFIVIFLLHMRAFYHFCGKFLLTKIRVIGLFVSTIVSLTTGAIAATYVHMSDWGIFLIDTLGLTWVTKPEYGSNDWTYSYSLFATTLSLCIVSIFVYLTACLFFCRQPNLEFKAVSTNQ